MITPTESSPEGEIHNLKDVNTNTTAPCDVFGTYTWVDWRKKHNSVLDPKNPPENCQAAILLEDSTLVYLQPTWESSAPRSKTELIKYYNKSVVVTGILATQGFPPPDQSAYITGPCLVGPISITDGELWDQMHGGELKL